MRLHVHVTPKSRAARVDASRAERTVRVRVTEAPEDGRANQAVIALLSERLGVPKSALTVVGGGAARRKWIEIDGLEEDEVWRRLETRP